MATRRFRELQSVIDEYARSIGEARDAFFYINKKFYCLDRVLDEVARLRELLRGKSVANEDKPGDIARSLIWAEFLAETFAYHAFAARRALRNLPGLKKFDPVGVRNARKLMEHFGEDKYVKKTDKGFAVFAEGWPIIRPQRFPGEPAGPMDKGIFANADEFIAELETKLSNEVKRRRALR